MKYLKITLCAFVISVLLSVLSVNAGVLGIQGVNLPILGGLYKSPWKTKIIDWKEQEYSHTGTIYAGKYVKIRVRTEQSTESGTIYSSYLTLDSSEEEKWYDNSANYLLGKYRVNIRQDKITTATAEHYGVWSYY
jgi:hypothetical protein